MGGFTREFAGAARYFVDNGLGREYWDIQRELDASLPASEIVARCLESAHTRLPLFRDVRERGGAGERSRKG